MKELKQNVSNFLASEKFNGALLAVIIKQWIGIKKTFPNEASVERVRRCSNIRKELIGDSKSAFVGLVTDCLDSGLSTAS